MPGSPLQVAKIYHDRTNRVELEQKVAAMLELSPRLPDIVENDRRYVQIAWPEALLRNEQGRFVGFLMPAVDVQATSELECILQERQARAAGLPTGLGAKITLAANLAVVIAALHAQQHHVIDLKPVNLRFYPQSLYMAMLDCDGFSIQGRGGRFVAEQITPDYLAPEFQGKSLSVVAEQQQDLFALAVVVFQLLNFGIHPFTGRPHSEHAPTDIPGRIAQRFYAYGLRANASLAPSPVSGHRAMPSDLRLLFDRAFESAGATRPSAKEWVAVLKTYALRSSQRLTICTTDNQHQHFAGWPCAACARAALIAATARNAIAAKAAALPSPVATRVAAIRAAHPAPSARPKGTIGSLATQPGMAAAPGQAVPTKTVWARVFGNKRRLVGILLWLMWMGFIITMSLGNSPTPSRLPATSAPSSQVQSVQPARTPDSNQGSLPDLAQNDVEVAAAAIISGDRAARESAIANLRGVAAQHPASQGGSYQPEFARFSSGSTDFDASERIGVMHDLEAAIRQDRYDGEAAYDLGWMQLSGGDRTSARASFVHAISLDPDQAEAWYGFGVATMRDEEAIGALAIAETLSPNPTLAQAVRDRFAPALLRLAGIKPQRFAILQAKARQFAAEIGGGQLPADIKALANQPLPPG